MSMEDFVEATCDNISKGNPEVEENANDKKETKKFYQIGAHVVLHNDKERRHRRRPYVHRTDCFRSPKPICL